MILQQGFELNNNNKTYIVEELLHSVGGYREVYRALEKVRGRKKKQYVSLIVYSTDYLPGKNMCDLPYREEMLRVGLKSDSFEKLICSFDSSTGPNGKDLHIMVTEYHETISLNDAVHDENIDQRQLIDVFKDVVIGLNEIFHANGGCHFNINPYTIQVRKRKDGTLGGIIYGLDAVSNDFDENSDINKNVLMPAYCPPESNFSQLTPVSIVFSLSMLLIFIIQKKHPWGLRDDATRFSAYTHIRHLMPKIEVEGALKKVLIKGLCTNPKRRHKSIDTFVDKVMDCLEESMPSTYVCFGAQKNKRAEDSCLNDNIEQEPESAIDEHNLLNKDPKIAVGFSTPCGGGLSDVAGMDGLKKTLKRDFIDVYRNHNLAAKYGLKIPSCLLYGPPGCGKSFIANKLAEEMSEEMNFISVTPSDLGNIYIHGSQLLIRQLFEKAANQSKATGKGTLIFLDEVDAMCPKRNASDSNNREGEVAEFLTQMNDLEKKNVFLVAATNAIENIDSAILRTGRFDKKIYVGLPDAESRRQLFEYELSKRPHDNDIDYDKLAALTEGFTSSDISYIVCECARRKFEDSLIAGACDPLQINQALLESVVASSSSSVSATEIKHYEEISRVYSGGKKINRPRVGFNILP